jgi:hypothetical protein
VNKYNILKKIDINTIFINVNTISVNTLNMEGDWDIAQCRVPA